MKYFYIIFFILITINSFSQIIEEIKKSDNYYWGLGKGNSLEQADKSALKDLISQISVQIESSMKSIWTEGNGTYKEFTESVTKTYSGATLDRAERKVEETNDGVTVLRYITKEKMVEIFVDRKNKIYDYIKSAQNAEKEIRIGDALKYYYWSLVLLRSHPDCNKIKYKISGDDELLLLTALPDKVNSILSLLKLDINNISENKDEKNIVLKINYQNQPVQNLDFTYWTGDTWTSLNSAKNGIGVVDFFGELAKSISDIRIKTEYIYLNNSKIDHELMSVLENTNTPFFKQAEIKISLKNSNESNKRDSDKGKIVNINSKEITKDYEAIIDKIKSAITNKNYSEVKPYFTNDGYEMFEKLIAYGKAKILPQTKDLKLIQVNNEIIVRSIPMSFAFAKNTRKFIEEVVFTFNKEKKVNTISFALTDRAISDITSKSEEFASTENKYQLIQFMEDYKTAYCLGRIDYLEKVFADNALIIVGHVLKEDNKPIDKLYLGLDEQKVKYIKYSKMEYLEKMKLCFKNNEFLNIQFDENTVKKAKADEKIYGIQIAQNYYSSNYADKGYLFLMIDLMDSINPKIYVRTWQPEKNPDGSIIGLTDFHF